MPEKTKLIFLMNLLFKWSDKWLEIDYENATKDASKDFIELTKKYNFSIKDCLDLSSKTIYLALTSDEYWDNPFINYEELKRKREEEW